MDRTQILRLLCEGRSPEAIARDGAANLDEVLSLKASAGRASLWYQDRVLRKLETAHVHLTVSRAFDFPHGGFWTWLAMDAKTKLVLSWALGARNGGIAALFLDEILSRLAGPAGITADNDKDEIVELASASRPDYRLVNKIFGAPFLARTLESESRVLHHRALSQGQNRAVQDYADGLALSALYNNFVRERDGTTPATASGIANGAWSLQDAAEMIDMWQTLKTGPWHERVVVLEGD